MPFFDPPPACIIARPTGGLANQMNVYAAAKALSLHHEVPLKLDLSYYQEPPPGDTPRQYELTKLAIQAETATPAEIHHLAGGTPRSLRLRANKAWRKLLRCPNPHIYHEHHDLAFDPQLVDKAPPFLMLGHFPSILHYLPALPTLRAEFRVTEPLTEPTQNWAVAIKKTCAVSLHVRRGDYAANPATAAFHGLLGVDYYQTAIGHMEKRLPHAEFFVFSDDLPWARGNLTANRPLHFVDANGPNSGTQDFHLMCCCQHHIIANSGFSRWPALLNAKPGKQVAMPACWTVGITLKDEEIAPLDWARL